jgi:hypothetical protein
MFRGIYRSAMLAGGHGRRGERKKGTEIDRKKRKGG